MKFPGTQIGEFLEQLRALRLKAQPKDWRWSGLGDLMADPASSSQLWYAEEPTPEYEELFEHLLENPDLCLPRSCYRNAALAALTIPEVEYVEGFAMSLIPMQHAWNLLPDGTIVDCTWCGESSVVGQAGTEYVGIVVPKEVLAKKVGTDQPMSAFDWRDLEELMKNPPDWLFANPQTARGRVGAIQYRHPEPRRSVVPEPMKWDPPIVEVEAEMPPVVPFYVTLDIHFTDLPELSPHAWEVVAGSLLYDLVYILRHQILDIVPPASDDMRDWQRWLSRYEQVARDLIDGTVPWPYEINWANTLAGLKWIVDEHRAGIDLPNYEFWDEAIWDALDFRVPVAEYMQEPTSNRTLNARGGWLKDLLLAHGYYGLLKEGGNEPFDYENYTEEMIKKGALAQKWVSEALKRAYMRLAFVEGVNVEFDEDDEED